MGRPLNPTLTKPWKIILPATLVGVVELHLMDPLLKKPRYASRSQLLEKLLTRWVEEEKDYDALVQRVTDAIRQHPNVAPSDLARIVIHTVQNPPSLDSSTIA